MSDLSNVQELLADKSIKGKEKTELLSRKITAGEVNNAELIAFAMKSKDPVRATIVEAFEFASREKPESAGQNVFEFAVQSLDAKAPRIRWEAAKVIGNLAARFPQNLDKALEGLLKNTEHSGTVVRWSAAFALGEIIKLNTKSNKDLIPAIRNILEQEEKNSIRKIYLAALKVIG